MNLASIRHKIFHLLPREIPILDPFLDQLVTNRGYFRRFLRGGTGHCTRGGDKKGGNGNLVVPTKPVKWHLLHTQESKDSKDKTILVLIFLHFGLWSTLVPPFGTLVGGFQTGGFQPSDLVNNSRKEITCNPTIQASIPHRLTHESARQAIPSSFNVEAIQMREPKRCGITLKGHPCKKCLKKGDYCHHHEHLAT